MFVQCFVLYILDKHRYQLNAVCYNCVYGINVYGYPVRPCAPDTVSPRRRAGLSRERSVAGASVSADRHTCLRAGAAWGPFVPHRGAADGAGQTPPPQLGSACALTGRGPPIGHRPTDGRRTGALDYPLKSDFICITI